MIKPLLFFHAARYYFVDFLLFLVLTISGVIPKYYVLIDMEYLADFSCRPIFFWPFFRKLITFAFFVLPIESESVAE
jgi:hypothetical protein